MTLLTLNHPTWRIRWLFSLSYWKFLSDIHQYLVWIMVLRLFEQQLSITLRITNNKSMYISVWITLLSLAIVFCTHWGRNIITSFGGRVNKIIPSVALQRFCVIQYKLFSNNSGSKSSPKMIYLKRWLLRVFHFTEGCFIGIFIIFINMFGSIL